jgi:hypothetical protein
MREKGSTSEKNEEGGKGVIVEQENEPDPKDGE